ncbi:hypothetical protein EVAR_50510_1 [Eumeta japonica]|uniref:Uncharacterized protein n=1 Tax=Eumeta variegata TaxID=151549 RepID=A0A4C1X6Q7_EUMVA|nr:hypothetical protein EVAR_50510_1 [Eumeta japonica]
MQMLALFDKAVGWKVSLLASCCGREPSKRERYVGVLLILCEKVSSYMGGILGSKPCLEANCSMSIPPRERGPMLDNSTWLDQGYATSGPSTGLDFVSQAKQSSFVTGLVIKVIINLQYALGQ